MSETCQLALVAWAALVIFIVGFVCGRLSADL